MLGEGESKKSHTTRMTLHGIRTILQRLPARSALLLIQRTRTPLCCTLDNGCSISEPRPEEDVGVGKKTLLKRDDDELRAFETCPEQLPDVLCM